ncbi:MAG: radical SAM protein [Muribaculaceae bacterium]|nr:radical SAM protein [Muribaculaceae bacterium]
MKLSLYNNILDTDNNILLVYNALSDKYVATSEYISLAEHTHPELVSNEALRSELLDIGFWVEDSIDEAEQVRELIQKHDHCLDTFHLHINPTVDCNFRCWYCYEDHKAGSRMKSETVSAIKRLIERKIADTPELKVIHLSFFGGEPLMGFENVVKPLMLTTKALCKAHNILHTFHFTTNGYLINERMLDFFEDYGSSFQITLDGYREHHDKVRKTRSGKGSYDQIVHNIIELVNRQCSVLVRINFTTENIDSIAEVMNDFRNLTSEQKQYTRFDLQRVWQDSCGEIDERVTAIVADYQQKLRDMGFNVSFYRTHDAVRSSCYGDKRNYQLINYDGGVYLCTARDFDDAHRAGTINSDGTIEWRNNAQECRLSAKFSKPICHTCRIAPICGGGCCTQALEHPEPDKCIYGYGNEQLDAIVATRFEQLYMLDGSSNIHSL